MEAVLSDWERVNHTKFCSLMYESWPHRFIGMGQYVFDYLPKDYYTFTTVRNPYDRYASGLAHCKNQTINVNSYWFHEHVLATQAETLGDLAPDYLMRLENIEGDYQYIKNKFSLGNLPKLNKSHKSELTDDMVEWVNEHFNADFELLGYERR